MLTNLAPLVFLLLLILFTRQVRRSALGGETWRRLRWEKRARGALWVLGIYLFIALVDSFALGEKTILDRLVGRTPERTYSAPLGRATVGESVSQPLKEPGTHLLGTDAVGNDTLTLTLKGVRTALLIGGGTSLAIVPLAVLLGLLAGYFGRRFLIDDLLGYVTNVLACIPTILLQIALILVLGRGIASTCLALGLTQWIGLYRLVRGEALRLREREFIQAAQLLGVGSRGILLRHLLPNVLPTVIIGATLGFGDLVLSETVLTYLGIGLTSDQGSWGNMLNTARDELNREPVIWWNLASSGTALLGLVLSVNILGDALRDALDPRLRIR